MLGWIFRKRAHQSGSAAAVVTVSPPPPARESAPDVDWTAVLARARGDDDALLALARTAVAPLRIKQAAVEALAGEAALRLAEREFRGHDRRAHQLAKQRLQAKLALRRTREQAAQLLETAQALAAMADVPANRIVELDHAWQSLDAAAVEPGQRDEFMALTARLAARLRQSAEAQVQRKRWQADALAAWRRLQAASGEAAAGTLDRGQLAESTAAARGVEAALPPGDDAAAPAMVAALADLGQAIRIATTLDQHLAVLDRLLAGSNATPPGAPEASGAGADAGHAPRDDAAAEPGDPQREWQALAPLPDPHLAALLQTRHARWQQAGDQARLARQSQQREQAREQARERQRTRIGEQLAALADSVAQAETAIDAGRLADAVRHLGDIEQQLHGADAPVALRSRIVAARARLLQLRGWQQWAGARAREELVLQAEALAAATLGGAQGKAGGEAESDGAADGISAVVAEVARLSIRQRADVIETLRKRWKEIDGPGGTGAHALWQRFDAALTRAGEPVAAHLAAQRAAREANLSARQQLLAALEAVADGAPAGPADRPQTATPVDDVARSETTNGPPAEPPAEPSTEPSADAPLDVRGLAQSLDSFHAEWRKLGPLEHAVPRAARAAVAERMAAALRRVEAPLQTARARAAAERQALVLRARALAEAEPGRARDLVGQVRALQTEWQQHAKALPLARADEQALWADFKAATDAAFAARAAFNSAREAEFEAHAAERSALIERLRQRPEHSPAALRRTLAEVEAAWQRCGAAPRARAAALEAEFRAAGDDLRRWLDEQAQRAWQATCDALDAKLALCLAREQRAADGAELDATATEAAWSALPALPAPLEDALRRRVGLTPEDRGEGSPNIDELLLRIECAWGLPSPPAFESARRQHKLLSMKESLEGRRPAAAEARDPVAALALVLSRDGLEAGQRDRLAQVLAGWRLQGRQRPS